ncbi:MAG: hypothetical protein HY902_17000 [Deltaproteobacteria bacterium]|nr:hypothetical protein [Deltaproteobacteria bacterium]
MAALLDRDGVEGRLHWNETLRADTYKSKKDFEKFREQTGLDFRPLDQFGPEELEYRHKLLFDLCCLIWPGPAATAG